MCAKKEPREVYQPLVDLDLEFSTYEDNPLPDFAWAGITAYYAFLENV